MSEQTLTKQVRGGFPAEPPVLGVAAAPWSYNPSSWRQRIQTAVLVVLMLLVLLGLSGPNVALGHVHPITPLLLLTATCGFWLVVRSRHEPMWRPRRTEHTVEDVPSEEHLQASLPRLVLGFAATAVLVTLAGAVVAWATGIISEQTELNETAAGGLLSGIATSLPELVTTVAAVRRGALTLAVSDIVGGNFFDVLFVFAADLVYFHGSIFHAAGVGSREIFLTALAVLLNAVLLLGLLTRQRHGPGNIGFESVLIVATYLAGFTVLSTLM
jgi:cation:H+ antiporter